MAEWEHCRKGEWLTSDIYNFSQGKSIHFTQALHVPVNGKPPSKQSNNDWFAFKSYTYVLTTKFVILELNLGVHVANKDHIILYSWYLTGTNFQWRLMQENIIKKRLMWFALEKTPHIHLSYKLVQVTPVPGIWIGPILRTLLNLLALLCFVCYWGFQPTFERRVLVELNETLVRAVGAGHRPQQHLLSVLLLAQIHLQKLKMMSS